MNPVLRSLLQTLERDPTDAVAIQALADHLEELGASPQGLRALTATGPTVLLFAHPPLTVAEHARLNEAAGYVAGWIEQQTGQPCYFLLHRDNVTVRQIRGTLVRPADPPPG